MSLTDRLAAARSRSDGTTTTSTTPAAAGATPADAGNVPAVATAAAARKKATGVDPFLDLKRVVHAQLVEALGPKLYDVHMTHSELEQQVRIALQRAIADTERPMSSSDRTRVSQEIADDILGYGPIEPLLRDSSLSEVMVNAFDSIYVERSGKLVKVDATFTDEAHLRRTIDKIVSKIGRRVDETSPMVDARLPDGSRVNAIIPPLALDGSKLTIRKFSEDPFTVEDLIRFGTPQPRLARACSRRASKGRLNILVSGGTGSGKTTMLNVLSSLHPRRRAHRHHRGRRRAPARAGPRAPPRVAPAQHRGQGRGPDPRPGQELAAHAPRPHRRRRDPRRRGARHAAGDEHRPRRLDLHPARQHPARRPGRVWRPWC